MTNRVKSFVFGGVTAVALVTVGIVFFVLNSNVIDLLVWGVLGVLGFTLVSCLLLDNNFVGEMIESVFSWGFVTAPGLIFELDLDGIIWFLTVKLLFWILGFLFACLCGIFAILLGLMVSFFVYPFALYKNVKHPEDIN